VDDIELVKVLSPWGNVTWDAYAAGAYVGNYRLRADAKRAALARRENRRKEQEQWDEDLGMEFGDPGGAQ
jgi:hypothetical protein